jgi:hypothetical protein
LPDFLFHPRWGRSLVGIEFAQAAAAPAGEQIGAADSLISSILKATGEVEEGAEQGGAVIVDELDQAGFLDEAAELDEMAGAGTTILDPLAGIVAGTREIEAVTLHGQALELRCRCLEFPQQSLRLGLSSPACRLAERRGGRVRSTSRRLLAVFLIARRRRGGRRRGPR